MHMMASKHLIKGKPLLDFCWSEPKAEKILCIERLNLIQLDRLKRQRETIEENTFISTLTNYLRVDDILLQVSIIRVFASGSPLSSENRKGFSNIHFNINRIWSIFFEMWLLCQTFWIILRMYVMKKGRSPHLLILCEILSFYDIVLCRNNLHCSLYCNQGMVDINF